MKKTIAVFTFLFSTLAYATDFSFIPSETPDQKEFVSKLKDGNGLKAWAKAFEGSAFASTMNGRGLYDYVLAQAGLPLVGLQNLVRETEAQNLSPALMELWQPMLNVYVTQLPPGLEFNASWKRLFSSRELSITKSSQIPGLLKQASNMSDKNLEKARLLWKLSTLAPQWNDTSNALKALNLLKNMKQSLIGDDQIELATARVLYQKADVKGAIEHYLNVPKSSEFWIESLEERAWAHLRLNEHDESVSDITTLLSEPFAPITGPETYFLSELSSLKVCDYPKILKTSTLFKKRHKERLTEISSLAKTGTNKGVEGLLAGFDKYGFSVRGAGPNIQWMPRAFMRDRIFASNMQFRLELMKEAKTAQDLNLPEMVANNQAMADQARSNAASRLQTLAQIDTEEYRITINKLHIVEAEVIERLYVDERLKGKRADVAVAKDERNTITFPYSDKEVWMDELDHYHSTVKNCPALPSTKTGSL
jgi:hypothetical protein